MISGEATNTNFTVFGLTQPGLKPTIYHTRSENANPYATDAAKLNLNAFYCINNAALQATMLTITPPMALRIPCNHH
jgi:hypothetical protein